MKKDQKPEASFPYDGLPIHVVADNGTAFTTRSLRLAMAFLKTPHPKPRLSGDDFGVDGKMAPRKPGAPE